MTTLTAPRPPHVPLVLRILAGAATVAVTLLGVWVTGGLVTNNFTVAMWLIPAWMTVAGLIVLAVAVRIRPLRVPVVVGYVVTAGALAAYLGSAMFLDRTINEEVALATGGNMLLAAASFEPVRHDAEGRAQVVAVPDGDRVLTLTEFSVDNGPDLRLYLVAGRPTTEGDVNDVVDLGGLKGNRGNQQYTLPPTLDLDRYSTVVVWCRAFSVLFARAPLERSST